MQFFFSNLVHFLAFLGLKPLFFKPLGASIEGKTLVFEVWFPENQRFMLCDPGGARTLDPLIKSQLLYQLSYGVVFDRRLLIVVKQMLYLNKFCDVVC